MERALDDQFLRHVYMYYRRGGFRPSIVRCLTQSLAGLFVIFFCTHLLFRINWAALHTTPITGPIFLPDKGMNGPLYTYLIWTSYIMWAIYVLLQFQHMQYAYDVSRQWVRWKLPSDVAWIPWVSVVQAMSNNHGHTPMTTLVQRHMRLDNYLTALSIENTFELPSLMYSPTIEWIIKQCFYASFFDIKNGPSYDFLVEANVAVYVRRLKFASWCFGIMVLIFTPVLFILEVMKIIMQSLANYQQDPTRFGHYSFTHQAMREMRDFNELLHSFHGRLARARSTVASVISVEMPTATREITHLFEIVSGSLLALIVSLGLMNQSAPSMIRFMGQNMYFWAGICGFIYISCRQRVDRVPMGTEDPEQKLDELVKELHHVPAMWGSLSLRAKFEEIHQLFRLSLIIQMGRIASTLCMPIFLLLWMPYQSERIIRSMQMLSTTHPSLGVVCKYALHEPNSPAMQASVHSNRSSSSSSLASSSGLDSSSSSSDDDHSTLRPPPPQIVPTLRNDAASIRSSSTQIYMGTETSSLLPRSVAGLRSSSVLDAKSNLSRQTLRDSFYGVLQ